MSNPPVTRKLAAILSADVQGYSWLMGEDEVGTIRTLTAYREVMTDLIEQHHGRVVDSPGDNLLAEFGSAVDAVEGAVAIQHELKSRNADLPTDRQMHYRIGINVGDVVVEGERIYGDGVNIAARLESLAEGGGISISGNVHEQVKNKLALAYAYQGEQQVKNIAEPVRVYAIQPATDDVSTSAPVQPVSRGRWSPISVVGMVLAMLGIGYIAWQQVRQPVTDSTPLPVTEGLALPDKPSIAVLPFTNMSNDPEQEYFSDGMTDTLITDLSKVSGLFVIARNSTFTYKGRAVKGDQVGGELGVQHVLKGSVQKADDRLRLNVQLINASTGDHVWAERYDRDFTDIFAVQDELVQKIVLALQIHLTPEQQAHLQRFPTENLEAYEDFLRAMEYFQQRTKEGTRQAQQRLQHALALDPQYAAAHVLLGFCSLANWFYQRNLDPQALDTALTLAHRAVALDDTLAWARMLLGSCYWTTGERGLALTEVKKGLALDPNFADAYAEQAQIHASLNARRALFAMEQAMRLNPHPPAWYFRVLGTAHHAANDTTKALTALQKAVAINPDELLAYVQLAQLYSQKGRKDEARAAGAEILRINPSFSAEVFVQRLPPIFGPDIKHGVLNDLRGAGVN